MKPNLEVKQVIVMRKDLGMRKGKMIAQGCHASVLSVLNQGSYHNEKYILELNKQTKDWMSGYYKKITLGVNSESELIEIHEKALSSGVSSVLVEDLGFTEFNGVKTKTCICLGPDYCEKIDKITKDLKLL